MFRPFRSAKPTFDSPMRLDRSKSNGSANNSIGTNEGGFLPDSNSEFVKSGFLQKWTNYLKGYRNRWFVLDSQGNLSYYRNKTEVGISCRGSINLQESRIFTDPGANTLTISGTSQSFHLKANNEIDRENWLASLEYARHHAIKRADTDEDETLAVNNGSNFEGLISDIRVALDKKLDDLRATELQISRITSELAKSVKSDDKVVAEKIKSLNTNIETLIQTSESLVDLTKKKVRTMSLFVSNEHDQRLQLQEQIETLAKQHSNLERAAARSTATSIEQPPYVESEEDEFHDAQEGPNGEPNEDTDEYDVTVTGDNSSRQGSLTGNFWREITCFKRDRMIGETKNDPFFSNSNNEIRKRRVKIPDRPQCSINLWSIMRNCIGKELTKIPMPVNFNEPLSVLQRITEDLEYADLLDRAAEINDSCEQMCYVAAYATSCYSTTGNRTTKPFNPLLGETYECDRTSDRGWWSVAEQVSHHPPSTAHHAEGRKWVMYQDFTMTSRFRGKYLSVTPTGYTHIKFKNSGNHYTYKKITTTVHNIIVGRLWIDNHGDVFPASSKIKKALLAVSFKGIGTKKFEIAKVTKQDKNSLETGNFQRIWTINPPYENSENMYRFTKLAIELNEEENGVAPTDSRMRRDQRIMEQGDFDKANIVKEEIEEKQRANRRKRDEEVEQAIQKGLSYPEYSPAWFDRAQDEFTGSVVHIFKGDYWQCKSNQEWTRCPTIF
ncbi:Oxysterol-binding protein [Aphelenchoides bicaudatus]|nr:Oxysterol-binding protein [Aphelenchoides bicaudatus]